MNRRSIPALGAATSVLVLASCAVALAAGTKVTVSIQGRTRALLGPTVVQTHGGFITRGGAPTGTCPAASAAGALDVATRHRWNAGYSSSLGGLYLTDLLGETYTFKSALYWSVWVNNSYAQTGVCGVVLHRGDHLLFAAEPNTSYWYPTALKAPSHATAGRAFKVTVRWFNTVGNSKPLAHARVHGSGVSATTNSRGTATITAAHAGTLVLQADRSGYIRATPVRVRITG
jgi:hypothetical protein